VRNRGCLAVNAAFLQEIKDDNRFLDELLIATRDALACTAQRHVSIRALVELLRRLRDRLATHFSTEEAFGYCENAVTFPEHWSARAEELRRQHASLYLEVCDVVESAEKLLYRESIGSHSQRRSMTAISAAFTEFVSNLSRHDADEYTLVDAILGVEHGVLVGDKPPRSSGPASKRV
jgi:hypothetical protein